MKLSLTHSEVLRHEGVRRYRFTSRVIAPVPTGQETGCGEVKSSVLYREPNPGRPAPSMVTVLTEMSLLHRYIVPSFYAGDTSLSGAFGESALILYGVNEDTEKRPWKVKVNKQ